MPAHLAELRPTDWPGETWRDCYDLWKAAQDAHHEAHGWPRGGLDKFMRRMLTRQRHERRPLHLGVSDYFGLPPERERHAPDAHWDDPEETA